jgi:methyl-accepting chemotaxis protein
MRPLKPPAPARPAAALRWWPPKSSRWRARPKATEEISEQIADIQKVAGEAVDAIKNIGGIIGEVNEVATAIAAAVQQQGAATQEITRSTQHAARGTKNVSDNINGVKADADAAAAAAEDVRRASETLETQSQQLGSQVSDFLGKIRAA